MRVSLTAIGPLAITLGSLLACGHPETQMATLARALHISHTEIAREGICHWEDIVPGAGTFHTGRFHTCAVQRGDTVVYGAWSAHDVLVYFSMAWPAASQNAPLAPFAARIDSLLGRGIPARLNEEPNWPHLEWRRERLTAWLTYDLHEQRLGFSVTTPGNK